MFTKKEFDSTFWFNWGSKRFHSRYPIRSGFDLDSIHNNYVYLNHYIGALLLTYIDILRSHKIYTEYKQTTILLCSRYHPYQNINKWHTTLIKCANDRDNPMVKYIILDMAYRTNMINTVIILENLLYFINKNIIGVPLYD